MFERAADGCWVAELAEQPNVQGFGDTLAEARTNIRDAAETLFGTEWGGFQLLEEIRLPEAVQALVRQARDQRDLAQQKRKAARAAELALATALRRAIEQTREAARLVLEHGGLMDATADRAGLVEDIRLSEALVAMVDRTHLDRQAAHHQHQATAEARQVAATMSSKALATNGDAARVLVEQCGLTVADAAGFLGLSPDQAQGLLGPEPSIGGEP